jgi:cytoskeletal protein RodZ
MLKWLKKDEKQNKPSIEEQQAEKLTQLGAKLATLRQEQGLSLDEIVLLTRISRRLLHAIEVGDLEDLPEPVYIQSLIRQFADALGLKGVDFASDFPVGVQQMSFQSPQPSPAIFQLRPFHLYLLYIFVIICSVNGLSRVLNQTAIQANKGQNQAQLQKNNSDLKPDQLQAKESKKSNSGVNTSESQTVEIGVTLKSSSWVRVVADGKTEFEGVLPEGSQRNWKAAEELTVKTNNAGNLLMSINQEQPKQMGEPGKEGEIKIGTKFKS